MTRPFLRPKTACSRAKCEDLTTTTFQAVVDAWAADVATGYDTDLFAWRRANVAELNRLWGVDGRKRRGLVGPELACPGGALYRAGDRVIASRP